MGKDRVREREGGRERTEGEQRESRGRAEGGQRGDRLRRASPRRQSVAMAETWIMDLGDTALCFLL